MKNCKRLLTLVFVLVVVLSFGSVASAHSSGDYSYTAFDVSSEVNVPSGSNIARAVYVGYITGNNVNLRSGPGTNYSSLGQVNMYDSVYFLDEGATQNGFYHVEMLSGQNRGLTGYVSVSYVEWGSPIY